MRRDIDQFATWVARWGFSVLVGIAASVALFAGATAIVPAEVPAVAL